MGFKRVSNVIPPKNENVEYGYDYSNVLLQYNLKLERCKLHFPQRDVT